MSSKTFEELFLDELKDVYDAEKRIVEAMPKFIKGAHSRELSEALKRDLEQEREHIARLDRVFEQIGHSPHRHTCKAMVGLLAEGEELLEESSDESVRDAAIIAAAQKVEHYEMATYGTLREWAGSLGHRDVLGELQKTLDEERESDKELTLIASTLNREAVRSGADH